LLDFSIAPEELYVLVEAHVASNNIAGWTGLGPVVSALKNSPELRWAAPLDVKNAVDRAFIAKFGPKESASAKSKTKVSRYCSSSVNRRRFNKVFLRNQNLRP
jgi:glutaminyl-tRNA synthetase